MRKPNCTVSAKYWLALCLATALLLPACGVKKPGSLETELANQLKKQTIGGKEWTNPTPDTPESAKMGAEHFQHHCQICHGLDGHGTGVPFAQKMAPPVVDLGDKTVQDYTDGQLKWIVMNGIRFTGMPAWNGILEDDEQWYIVRYLRHLPAKGSLGAPPIYTEEEEAHEKAMHQENSGQPPAPEPEHNHHHH